MTESIHLALITLCGTIATGTIAIIIVSMILKANPSNFKISWSEHGTVEASFNTEVDE